jgi:hypothetical protein
MKNFKIRLRFTHTSGNYQGVMDVFHLHDLGKSVGTCTVKQENNEIIGYMVLNLDVDEGLYVYYRYNIPEGIYHAIQFLAEPQQNTEALTIRELLR